MTLSYPSCSSPCLIPFYADVASFSCFLRGFPRCDRVGSVEKLVKLVAGVTKGDSFRTGVDAYLFEKKVA
jgi:hypothetical protein